LATELIGPGQALVAGTEPGVIAGSVIRVELLPGPRVFDLVVAAVLVPLGSWLTTTRPISAGDSGRPVRPIPAPCCSSWRPVWAASAIIVVTLICTDLGPDHGHRKCAQIGGRRAIIYQASRGWPTQL
jgi:hypothetical protein